MRITTILFSIYRLALSPILYSLGARCRFHPSCSVYARQAFENHSFFRALWLSAVRLSKCGPWHPGGVDELPTNLRGVANEI